MTKAEIIKIEEDADAVSCDGGGGALGHPLVWYSFNGLSSLTCGYCGRVFTKAPKAVKAAKEAKAPKASKAPKAPKAPKKPKTSKKA